MKILCMGSVNVDKTYRVDHIPKEGETILARGFRQGWGGKGLNQEEIDEINQPFDYDWGYWKNENRGIGLRYVKAMLESFYDGQTSLFVNSKKGFGTKITILLPVREPEEKKEKDKDKEVTLEENKVGQTDERIDCR